MANVELVEHLVVVVMENRSFDHMLGYLSLSGRQDVDGLLDTPEFRERYGNPTEVRNEIYYPKSLYPDLLPFDPPHRRDLVHEQMALGQDGVPRMTGFVKAAGNVGPAKRQAVMSYQTADSVWVYDHIARNYAISDRWFSSVPTSTQPNRLMLLCGYTLQDGQRLELLPHHTVYEWLDEHRVDWRAYYRGICPFITLMPHRHLPQLVHDPDLRRFRDEWSGPRCPSVIFVEPRYYFGPIQPQPECDHPHRNASVAPGQRFLYEVLKVIAGNPERWRKTMVIITYDEHGGLFDHVAPPEMLTQCGKNAPFPFLGIRVPALVVSPFTLPGTVLGRAPDRGKDLRFDHTSILKFIGERWGRGHYSDWVDPRPVASLGAFVTAAPLPDARLTLPADREDPPVPDPAREESAVPEDALPIACYLRNAAARKGDERLKLDFPGLTNQALLAVKAHD